MSGVITGKNCTVVSNSLVLKGDKLADGSIVAGIPSVPVKNSEPEDTEDDSLEIKKRPSNLRRGILIALVLIAFILVNIGVSAAVGIVISRRHTAPSVTSNEQQPSKQIIPLERPSEPIPMEIKKEANAMNLDEVNNNERSTFIRKQPVILTEPDLSLPASIDQNRPQRYLRGDASLFH